MNKNIRLIALLVIFVCITLFSGCCGYKGPQKYTGGGWIEVCNLPEPNGAVINLEEMFNNSCVPEGKATFGFQFQGKADDICDGATISGQLQWNDHLNGIKFHGIVDNYEKKCRDSICFDDADCVLGVYRTQPTKLGDGGEFQLCVRDYGEPGPDEGDMISIRLTGGYHDGYAIMGHYLGGGNIQEH